MKFRAVIGSSGKRSIEMEWFGDGRVLLDGTERQIDFHPIEPGVYSLLVDGASHEVTVREEKKGFVVDVGGHLIPVKLQDPSKTAGPLAQEAEEGEAVISSPMPGRVIRVSIAEGDTVKAGQGVIVVEAMKMENELPVTKSGKVKKIAVKIGDAVEAGQELVVVE